MHGSMLDVALNIFEALCRVGNVALLHKLKSYEISG